MPTKKKETTYKTGDIFKCLSGDLTQDFYILAVEGEGLVNLFSLRNGSRYTGIPAGVVDFKEITKKEFEQIHLGGAKFKKIEKINIDSMLRTIF